MLSKRFLVISIIVLALALVSLSTYIIIKKASNPDHDYYPELTEFTYRITNYPDVYTSDYMSPIISPIIAEYVKQELSGPEQGGVIYTEYIFKPVSGNAQMALRIPMGAADNISMVAGEEYKIDHVYYAGWPYIYHFIIYENESVIFLGITDWSINNRFYLSDFLPIKIEQTKILTNHYIIGGESDFWTRKTNTEITFTLDGKSVTLHQGQSAILGDYNITLLIAREIEYPPICYDCAQNGISYVISRKN
jgi:hypothetical protein